VNDSSLFLDDQLGLRLVNVALMKGLITPEDWTAALTEQAAEAPAKRRPLCVILIARGLLTRSQLRALRAETERAPGTRRAEAPAPPPLLEGSPVKFGKYRLSRELGRGVRGGVFEAFDTLDGRRLALKLFRAPDGPSDAVSREEARFLQEASAALRLPRHPGVVAVQEAGVALGRRYLAMELVDGPSLDRWAQSREDPRARLELLRLAAEALHHAHEHGVGHEGLSARDILVDAKGRARVVGLTRPLSRVDERRDDLRALGAVLKTLLGTREEPELRRLAERAERLGSAAEFSNALLRWMDGSRRGRRPLTIVAGTLALLAAASPLLLFRPGPEAPPPRLELSRGLRPLPAGSSPLESEERELRLSPDAAGECRLALDVDENWAAATSVAELSIEVFDGASGRLELVYDATGDADKAAPGLVLKGSRRWISWTTPLPDPRFFNRQSQGGDLRVVAAGLPELRIRRVALRRVAEAELPRIRLSPASAAAGLRLRIDIPGLYLLELRGELGGAAIDGLVAAELAPGVYPLRLAQPGFACYQEREGRRVDISSSALLRD